MSMITATQWVPRGFAAPTPTKYELDEAEFERIAELAKLHLEDANEDLKEAQETGASDAREEDALSDAPGESRPETWNPKKESRLKKNNKAKFNIDQEDQDDDLKEYDLEHYDDDDDSNVHATAQTMSMFANAKSLAYYESNDDDPYITLKDGADDEEEDELRILATDNLLLVSKVEDEVAHLEVHVYEDGADNIYVHHDLMLPAIPLCVEWINYPVQKQGVAADTGASFVAVGTMDPDIEIWDLDVVDSMYPNAILGEPKSDGGKRPEQEKKRKNKSKKPNNSYHVDAVLALAANKNHRNLLASASADTTIKLWDLATATCASSYGHHADKVCSLAWNVAEPTVLLSGSYDRTVAATDMRAPSAACARWGVDSDVETVKWDPYNANLFFVATEGGVVHLHDARAAPQKPAEAKAVWTLQAHDEAVTAFDVNPAVPGFLATGSADRTVKLWNVAPGAAGPTMVVSRNPDVGKVFSAGFAPDGEVAFRLAVAGSKGELRVWDTSTNAAVRTAFAHRVPERIGVQHDREDRLVGLKDDESESESESGEEEGDGGARVESMDED